MRHSGDSQRCLCVNPCRAQILFGLALGHALSTVAAAQTAIPGKYYEYYTVAKTGSGFTDFGFAGPSINDAREVAFRGSTSSGNGLWLGTGNGAAVNFNPGESFGSSDIIQPGVQANANHQVVSEDRITTTSPATTSIRRYNANATDSYVYIARGGPFHTGVGGYLYDAVFANPAINKNGDVVFTAQYSAQAPVKVLGYVANGSTTPVERAIRVGNPKPMIADNGVVVIQVGGSAGQANLQILVYPTGLGSPVVLADTANNWVSLDNDPGISRDGRVVAFQGNPNALGAAAIGTTTGPGIFAAIDEGSGFGSAKIIRLTGGKIEDVAADRAAVKGNYDGVCDTGEICKAGAELGFDSAGNPITIASYASDSRVGVVNVDFGAAGIDDDTFVVSFIATPSGASRGNPALAAGTPMLFSAQQGLWTLRVDVRKRLAGNLARVYQPFTPIPVIQVGDKLGTDTITGLGVYDPIANAAHDEQGNIRTMRRGDHRVAFWASTAAGQVVVRANHLDSDQDGLLDHWETTGIDMDQDGTVDLHLADYGADVFTRDLFLQVDWVGKTGFDNFKPAGGVFGSDTAGNYSLFEANLRGAEALGGAMFGARIDGSNPIDIRAGVVPHVDAGSGQDSLHLPMSINLGTGTRNGGNYIGMPGATTTLPQVVYFGQPGRTVSGVNIRSFQEIKDTFLGASGKYARLLAFHYMVFGPFQDFYPNYPATPYSATIAAVPNAFTIEVNAPLSSFPKLGNGAFLLLTSGAGITGVRQIQSKATNGVTGNAVFSLSGSFSPVPAVGNTVAFLDGSSGIAEVAFSPQPDNNSLPGNDVIVSAGALGVLQGAPPNQCLEGETASHELGHTLGLRHGGIDQNAYHPGADYRSVMSYTWQLECTPSALQSNYSMAGDTTFDDYGNLQFNFHDVQFHLSTSLGESRGEGFPDDFQQQVPEQNLLDVIAKNGPMDTVPPTISITSPGPGGSVAVGSNLTVNVTAADNVQISRVSIAFDINGNGITNTSDAVNATKTGTNTYQAIFTGVGGSPGARTLSAIAFDGWSNAARTEISVTVGSGAPVLVPNVVGMTQAAASSAISTAGLTVGTISQLSSNSAPVGSVISENPVAGTSVPGGSAVNLVVSSGPFIDVAAGDFFYDAVNLMLSHGITGGCAANPPKYCPNDNVTRAQMAIFIVRSIVGGDNFTYSATPHFSDVGVNDFGFKWIQKMFELSITAGCGNNNYCPNDAVTRGQMAIFVIRGRLGAAADATFTFPAAPSFTDVPANYPYFKWIQRMKLDSITGGCGTGVYCPDDPVTRGQMAIFIVRGAFNQLLPAGTPVIAGISPAAAPLGQTTLVTVTGTNTSFAPGTTQVTAGPGVTTGTITVTNATTLTVQLTVAANATAGQRTITVTTGSQQAVLPNGLTVP